MPRFADLWHRLRTLLQLRRAERELDEEFTFHVEMSARQLEAGGLPPDQALAESRRRFGGLTRERQRARDEWGIGWVRDLAADFHHAFRQFRRRPGFTLLGTLTLALGIGATVALFSVVQGLLLRPLPVRDEAQLQVFWDPFDWRGVEFDFVKERVPELASLAAYSLDVTTLEGKESSSALLTTVSSAELFDVLGAAPLMGRTFAPGEDRPGAEPVAILSWTLWQQDLGGDPAVIGRRVRLDGKPATVIGVMPRGFFFPTPDVRLWRPLRLDPASGDYQGNGYLVLVGRVRPEVSAAALDGGIERLAHALGERFTYPAAWDKTKDAGLTSLRDFTVGDVEPALLLLLSAVTLLLLMASANVAALVLARTTDRTPEIALRAALGAGRGRLVRQIVTESVALAGLAGVVGAALATGVFRLLVRSLPLRNGLEATLSLDWTMLLTAFGLALVVGLLVSAAPVRELLRGQVTGVSRERSRAASAPGHRRVHGVLVGVEVALAVTLAAGSFLFVRSVARLFALDPGFDPKGVMAFDLVSPTQGTSDAERRQTYLDLLDRVLQRPEVASAGFAPRVPIRDPGYQGPVEIEDRPDLRGPQAPNAAFRPVTPGYFAALGIDLVGGRGFTAADQATAPRVAIVSESFARSMWPGRDPIGRRVQSGVTGDAWLTVVGVAEEARVFSMTGPNPMVLYLPLAQMPSFDSQALLIRARGDLGPIPALVRQVVRERAPDVAVGRVTTMDQVLRQALAEPIRLRFFLSLFAALALALGGVGVYGVVSYSVTRRRTEFGVRMALGAEPGRVVREVVRGALAPVVAGIGAGLVLTLLVSRLVAGLLYGIAPTDPLSLGLAGGALLTAGTLAALLPGLRAGRTSPIASLRSD
jgi:putative ABC transport system permease protein